MKIFDMHVHAYNTTPEPDKLIKKLEAAGVWGCTVFSSRPLEHNAEIGASFEDRLSQIFAWTKGYEDRLFPVLWIHPDEENVIEKINIAAERGVCAFKMICNSFYVYEERVLLMLREMAKLNKPVFFHSGILWDGGVSSKYNRPLNWEAVMEIEGLKFSLGHCSWPWIDECIALYGKFLNSRTTRNTAEMFFDITPGTPPIYREELLTKLYNIGYDMGDNILFGTDCRLHTYKSEWASGWLERDRKILDKLGVSKEYRQKLYSDNLMRFLGKTGDNFTPKSPVPDDSNMWSAENSEVKKIIEKWYKKLNFSKYYDGEFYKALSEVKISDAISIETYEDEGDGRRNFLSFLYFCEELKNKYDALNISEEIFYSTIADIKRWLAIWTEIKGGLYLGEISWLRNHLGMKLFRLGSLQFCIDKAHCDLPEVNTVKGDNVLSVHITANADISYKECQKSVELAREFFKTYFPQFDYKCFTCHSWLLDETLKNFLNENSNILQFQKMYKIVESEKSNEIIRYLFKWNTTEENLRSAVAVSSFAEKVKRHILSGEHFCETTGYIEK